MTKRITTEKQDQEMVWLYNEGLSSGQVAKKIGVPKYIAKRRIKEAGASRKRTVVHKYSVNNNVFSAIDNEASAYALGFIYADGTVSGDRVLKIMLSETDRGHLEKLGLLLGSNYPVLLAKRTGGYKSNSIAVVLKINSPKLIKDLADCGVVIGRERFHKTQGRICEDVRHHFIRGYLDGDGCIRGNYNPSVTFVGQPDILAWIRATFHAELSTNPNLSILKGKGVYSINYVGINQATLICEWLYKDATIWLQRKRAKFEEWPKPKNKRRFKY